MEQEDAPLLGSRPSTAADRHVTQRPQLVPDSWSGFSASFKYCIVLELLCELAMMILAVPMVSALEYAICARHFHDNIPTPELCKAPSIQRNLAEIRGWTVSFETFSAIVVALPIGRIADHRGQRGVYMIVVAGILMSLTWTLIVLTNHVLPIKLVWASSVFLLVGGGRYAAEMLLAAMIAKACTEDTRYSSALETPEGRAYVYRTRGLYYFYSCFIFSELTNALISEVALVNLVLFFFIMPTLLHVVSKYLKPTPQVLNLGIVRASLSLLFLGSLLLGFATNSAFLIAATMIYGLGFGARSTLLSLVTSWIDPQHAGTLFSAVFLVEQIGLLFDQHRLHAFDKNTLRGGAWSYVVEDLICGLRKVLL
ncbi:major facilitator superfamily transporter [Fusarium mundagurra]|uniref:Major facilitator superfamily transporter n=1 Tax=Fusarium mundagurra TaxID=1567541 RepID=A0A8H6D6M9_9HYPO|nr:major facilitator superfamily transporter [Fusarium mundagurra]